MPETTSVTIHKIFLLSCWGERDAPGAPVTWRYQIEQPRTNMRHVCASLDQLVEYLQDFQNVEW